jgi:tetratricopeptide (TPR) repeat protein
VEKKIIDAKVTLGLYYNQMFHHVEAKEAVEPIIELALERNYKRSISQINTIIGTYNFMIEGDYRMALRYLEEALEIAEELEDRLSLFLANHWIGHALAENCNFEKALDHVKKALEINKAANVLWGISAMKGCIAMTVYNNQGKAGLGYQMSQEVLQLTEEIGDMFLNVEANTYYGCACYLKGFLDEAERHLLKGIIFSEKFNIMAVGSLASFYLGETYFDKKEYQKSQAYHGKAILLLEHCRVWPSVISSKKIAFLRAEVMNGEKDIDIESLYEHASTNKIKLYEGMVARHISDILLNIENGHIYEAEDWIKKAIEMDKRNGLKWWHLAMDYAHYAELFQHKGDLSKAREYLIEAIKIFKECGADGWMNKYTKELAALQK